MIFMLTTLVSTLLTLQESYYVFFVVLFGMGTGFTGATLICTNTNETDNKN
jgi:hypothetical protein